MIARVQEPEKFGFENKVFIYNVKYLVQIQDKAKAWTDTVRTDV